MYENVKEKIQNLAIKYSTKLASQMSNRENEMLSDSNEHYLLYKVLGITTVEGQLIDLYQNKGRFLYKYAGSFLEESALICFESKFADAKTKVKVENKIGKKPKMFEIDCLVDNFAIEIKWRDATTDGDHITKEHTRLLNMKNHGYTPVRLMFYYPNRTQAMKIQNTLKTVYIGVQGEYYSGTEAWQYLENKTGINLLQILEEIVQTETKTSKL